MDAAASGPPLARVFPMDIEDSPIFRSKAGGIMHHAMGVLLCTPRCQVRRLLFLWLVCDCWRDTRVYGAVAGAICQVCWQAYQPGWDLPGVM